MEELKEDILCFAVSRYLMATDLTPYDAVVENSDPKNSGNPSDEWVPTLMSLMADAHNVFRRDEMVDADPVKNPIRFQQQSDANHERTVKVATIGAMLCQKWLCENVIPYSDNQYLTTSEKFIYNVIMTFV